MELAQMLPGPGFEVSKSWNDLGLFFSKFQKKVRIELSQT